ncbi:MAG TPA: response regulator transcription factor [Plasticicumulans sp.]|nr:response regulator transcription factor [Plasticicumulans sp.]
MPVSPPPPIRVLLVDDHAVVRAGFRRLLEGCGVRVSAEADTGEAGYRAYVDAPCDVVILDLALPGRGGLETLRRLRARDAGARVLVFTMHDEPAFAEQALAAGALGYVTKSSSPEVLLDAVTRVARGERCLSPDIAERLALAPSGGPQAAIEALSPREFEIFRQLAAGHSAAEIGERLALSAKTVANYGSQIRARLGVGSRAELARLAIRLGLIEA